jgi:hypothetical protein
MSSFLITTSIKIIKCLPRIKEHIDTTIHFSFQTNAPALIPLKNIPYTYFFAIKTLENQTHPNIQVSLNVFVFKIHHCLCCRHFHRYPNPFSSRTSKVNILHCYRFVFGLVEIK